MTASRAWIVVDPGHGGSERAGSSTPYGCGSGDQAEKHIALDIARRVRAHAPERVLLTRDRDCNLSLAERILVARGVGAGTFLSIHTGGASGSEEAWIHARAGSLSRRLGACVAGAFSPASKGRTNALQRGDLAILDPDFHDPEAAACLLELGCFGNQASMNRLNDPRERQRIADTLAGAVLSQSSSWSSSLSVRDSNERTFHAQQSYFDVWHEVPLVEQLTGMSCWAAAAAMIVGWRDCIDLDADEVARGGGRWKSFRDGLEPRDVGEFAREWELAVARPSSFSVENIRRLLEEFGPLWVGEASPGLHVIVVAGLYGDGSLDGTFVRIADPWPIGRGERYTLSFREFEANLRAAMELSGGSPQILHARTGSRAASFASFAS